MADLNMEAETEVIEEEKKEEPKVLYFRKEYGVPRM